MIEVDTVRKLVEQRIENTDIFIVDISVSANNAIKVVLDADSGLSIDKCVAVSRQVEHNLDRDSEDFSLEVSSFGLTQPLQMLRQYRKNIGRQVKITLNDNALVRGKLTAVDDDKIVLERKLSKKEIKENADPVLVINLDDIKEIKVEISFK